jgi:hypothetical protein
MPQELEHLLGVDHAVVLQSLAQLCWLQLIVLLRAGQLNPPCADDLATDLYMCVEPPPQVLLH